jgi:hypothetical protein
MDSLHAQGLFDLIYSLEKKILCENNRNGITFQGSRRKRSAIVDNQRIMFSKDVIRSTLQMPGECKYS